MKYRIPAVLAALFIAGSVAAASVAVDDQSRQHAIIWPSGFLPGTTDNFVSNEVIVTGVSVQDVWLLLAGATRWPGYYPNSADVRFYNGKGPLLAAGERFFFKTFGFPVEAQVTEYVPPAQGNPGRLAWHGWSGAEGSAERLDVIHAWLVEELPGDRVRILTQESQKGQPAQVLASSKPNIMVNGHQDWLVGLVAAARRVNQ